MKVRNVSTRVIDLPGGALLAPGEEGDYEHEEGKPDLVAAGLLEEAGDGGKKSSSSSSSSKGEDK